MALANRDIVPAANRGDIAHSANGNFWTTPGWSGMGPGAMGYRLQDQLVKAVQELGRVEQVIYSYYTPIAFKFGTVWIIPEESYSATTASKHKSELYRLVGRREEIPMDATAEDIVRIVRGQMRYVRSGRWDQPGRYIAGPNQ